MKELRDMYVEIMKTPWKIKKVWPADIRSWDKCLSTHLKEQGDAIPKVKIVYIDCVGL